MDSSLFKTRICRAIWTLLEVRPETEVHFVVGTVILGLLSLFKNSQDSFHYEALNTVCLSRCQRNVRPAVHIRRTPSAFSRVSIGDSDMPSSCEVKNESEFKTLQGNWAFF